MTTYNLLGRDVEEVYGSRVARALTWVDNPFFMPDFIRARLSVERDHRLWQTWWTAPSLRATGRTAQGNAVVLYAHVKNFYSDAENVRAAIDDGKLVRGAGPLSQEEFTRLLSLEGDGVFVIDHATLRKSPSGVIKVSQALAHPQTIPFLGVSQEEAQMYLQKHEAAYGDRIGISFTDYSRSDPFARLLFLGDRGDLFGYYNLDDYARVLGVFRDASLGVRPAASIVLENGIFIPSGLFY